MKSVPLFCSVLFDLMANKWGRQKNSFFYGHSMTYFHENVSVSNYAGNKIKYVYMLTKQF